MSYAIVAIPSDDDYVWKISSEKIPHITLLVLDDSLINVDRVTEYIKHVANTSLSKFYLNVIRRGTLGDNTADVLFFSDNSVNRLNDIRSYLLDNKDIFVSYNATRQYDSWTPHLTLGYPETPAKPDNREYSGIYSVNFDRIALWNGNYEGPEFLLKIEEDVLFASYSIQKVNSNLVDNIKILDSRGGSMTSPHINAKDILEHIGVLGMKWGVRRNNSDSKSTATMPLTPSQDAERAAKLQKIAQKRSTKVLSNQELQHLVTRMNLEQQYARLRPPSKKQQAAKLVTDILVQVGKQQAQKLATDQTSKLVEMALKNAVKIKTS